jgi:hypothetical protein
VYDVRWGLAHGLLLAAFIAVVVVALHVVSGGRNTASVELSLPVALAFYGFAGAVGGVMLGLCRPILTYWYGALLAGFLITLPSVLALGWLWHPHWPLTKTLVGGTLISLVAGPFWAGCLWIAIRNEGRSSR